MLNIFFLFIVGAYMHNIQILHVLRQYPTEYDMLSCNKWLLNFGPPCARLAQH